MSIVLLAVALAAAPAVAQESPDDGARVAAFARAATRARVKLAADAGVLWGHRLDTIPWLGVLGQRVFTTADPAREGYVPASDGLWSGPLPAGVAPANTSVEWAGRRWAMVLLPVPSDAVAAERLLVHELWHVAQPALLALPPAGEGGAGARLLEEPGGRTWLQLEWRALAAALVAVGAGRDAAIADALVFRARRYMLASPQERERERLLDVAEGMAEYTAWTVAGGSAAALARQLRHDAPASPSFVRSFPYHTGPAYGLLAEARAGRTWTRGLHERADVQVRMAELLGARGRPLLAHLALRDTAALTRVAHRAAARYGRDSLVAAERSRWVAHETRLALAKARFVDGPAIRLRPASLYITFDPSRQTSLGAAGTVMGGLAWTSVDGGRLDAPGGGLVSPDWKEVRLPLEARAATLVDGPLAAPLNAVGDGWRLTLPAGWLVERVGRDWVLRPPR